MYNDNNLTTTLTETTLTNSTGVSGFLDKLSGDNITSKVIAGIMAITVGYVCSNGGSLEIASGDMDIKLSSPDKAT